MGWRGHTTTPEFFFGTILEHLLQDRHYSLLVTRFVKPLNTSRRVILAIPPHIAARIDYAPGLPAMRDQLTQRMPIGASIKSIALYDRPFWRERGESGNTVSTTGPVHFTFDLCSADGKRSAIVAFILGDRARYWTSQPLEARRGAVLEHLGRLLGPGIGALLIFIGVVGLVWFVIWVACGYGMTTPIVVLEMAVFISPLDTTWRVRPVHRWIDRKQVWEESSRTSVNELVDPADSGRPPIPRLESERRGVERFFVAA